MNVNPTGAGFSGERLERISTHLQNRYDPLFRQQVSIDFTVTQTHIQELELWDKAEPAPVPGVIQTADVSGEVQSSLALKLFGRQLAATLPVESDS